ncbi:MAG: hypothetical protein U1D70_12140, partial [Methylobacter sp.]|nr:hypothetical protein [Methylobacter sp.]
DNDALASLSFQVTSSFTARQSTGLHLSMDCRKTSHLADEVECGLKHYLGYQLNTGQTFQVLKTWKVYFGILVPL